MSETLVAPWHALWVVGCGPTRRKRREESFQQEVKLDFASLFCHI